MGFGASERGRVGGGVGDGGTPSGQVWRRRYGRVTRAEGTASRLVGSTHSARRPVDRLGSLWTGTEKRPPAASLAWHEEVSQPWIGRSKRCWIGVAGAIAFLKLLLPMAWLPM